MPIFLHPLENTYFFYTNSGISHFSPLAMKVTDAPKLPGVQMAEWGRSSLPSCVYQES